MPRIGGIEETHGAVGALPHSAAPFAATAASSPLALPMKTALLSCDGSNGDIADIHSYPHPHSRLMEKRFQD